MEKHAYLIMVHNHVSQVRKLLSLLDDARNDIYIHIDLKSELTPELILQTPLKYSKVEFCDRVDVRWANISVVEAELNLMVLATKTYHAYYHLLSGVDLPLQTQDYIHGYLEGKDLIYMGFVKAWNLEERIFCHNVFTRHIRTSNPLYGMFLNRVRKLFNYVQLLFNYRKKLPDLEFKKGAEWASMPMTFVWLLLQTKKVSCAYINMLSVLMKVTNRLLSGTLSSEAGYLMMKSNTMEICAK